MRKGVLVGIVLVLVVVIVASAWALMYAGAGKDAGKINLMSSSYTAEEGRAPGGLQEVTVTDDAGNQYTMWVEGTDVTTYVNVTVSVFNSGDERRVMNLTASVYDARDNRYYHNTDWTGDYGDYQLYEYGVEPGASRTVVLTIEVPRSLPVTDDMVIIYLDGAKV
jgi:hypothetical protein